MDGFHDLQVTFPVQRAQHRLERCALLLRRHRRLYTEQALDQLRVIVRSVFRVIQHVVDIRPAAVKGREQEAELRCGGRPARRLELEALFLRAVAQRGLRGLDRADSAEDVGENGIPVLERRAVARLEGHVIALVGQHDEIVPLDGERIDHGLVKLPERFLVCELRLAQLHEQTVLVAVRDLLGAEGQVEQIFVDGAGECLLEQAKIKLLIVLRADRKRLPEAGENFAAVRNVAAVNGCDIGAIRAQTPPQLADLFFSHGFDFLYCLGVFTV